MNSVSILELNLYSKIKKYLTIAHKIKVKVYFERQNHINIYMLPSDNMAKKEKTYRGEQVHVVLQQ